VLVDGAAAGVSTAEQGGALVQHLAPGQHRVIVRSSDGREGSFSVAITDGQMTSIEVSPLGLRRKLARPSGDDSGMLKVVSLTQDCVVQFRGESQKSGDGEEVDFDRVPAGRYPLVVTQGKRSFQADIEIPAASIVSVQPDFKAGVLRITDTRPKPRRLDISEANDALTPLLIPSYWKSEIRNTLPAGVSIIAAVPVAENAVRVTMRVPSQEVGFRLIEAMLHSTAFARITAADAPRQERNAWVVDFTFYFQ